MIVIIVPEGKYSHLDAPRVFFAEVCGMRVKIVKYITKKGQPCFEKGAGAEGLGGALLGVKMPWNMLE